VYGSTQWKNLASARTYAKLQFAPNRPRLRHWCSDRILRPRLRVRDRPTPT
jgi:hypothetical protein